MTLGNAKATARVEDVKPTRQQGGFYMIPDSIAVRTNLTPTDKLLFGGILRLASAFGTDHVFSSQVQLAKRLGISPDTQTRSLKRLEKAGLLLVKRERGPWGTRLKFYILAATVEERNRNLRVLPESEEPAFCGTNREDPNRDRASARTGASSTRDRAVSLSRQRRSKANPGAQQSELPLIAVIFDRYSEDFKAAWRDQPGYLRRQLIAVTRGLHGQDGEALIDPIVGDVARRELTAEGQPIEDRTKYLITTLQQRLAVW